MGLFATFYALLDLPAQVEWLFSDSSTAKLEVLATEGTCLQTHIGSLEGQSLRDYFLLQVW
jgi:hypothetical protein